jgi:hypothetical protein
MCFRNLKQWCTTTTNTNMTVVVVVVVVVTMTTRNIHHASSLRDEYMNAGEQGNVKIIKQNAPTTFLHTSGIQKILYIKTVLAV